MQQYRVLLDGVDIYDMHDKPLTLLSPKVIQDLTTSGSFEFTMPYEHLFYNEVQPYKSTINVLEQHGGGTWKTVFYGRPLPCKLDYRKRKIWHCEGALSWLSDIVLPRSLQPNQGTLKDTATYVTEIISYYNSRVPADRQFVLSVLPAAGTNLTEREWKYQSCMEALKQEADDIGAVLFVRRNNTDDETGIRLTKLIPYVTAMEALDQPIQLGLNITDMTQSGEEVVTACIGTGAEGVEMTAPVVLTEQAARYGLIESYQEFRDCTTVAELEAACREWLEAQWIGGLQVDVSALDLHTIRPDDFERLEIARKVVFDGSPWGLGQRNAPITKVEIDMGTGRKKITLGFTAPSAMPMTRQIGQIGHTRLMARR